MCKIAVLYFKKENAGVRVFWYRGTDSASELKLKDDREIKSVCACEIERERGRFKKEELER